MKVAVDEALAGCRLDAVVVGAIEGLGRAGAKRLFAEGRVLVIDASGRRRLAKKGDRAALGTTVEIDVDKAAVEATPDPETDLVVLHEGDDFVVVDKPAGIPSAPLRPGERGTVANALFARYPEMKEVGFSSREPGLCHRLDIGTSGLLVAARNARAFSAFTSALRAGQVDKAYLAVVRDDGLPEDGRCEGRLEADPADARRVRLVEGPGGRPAFTRYRVLRRMSGCALVEAHAARAFRHQVRVHLAAAGAPLVGDLLYGGEPVPGLERHALHASAIAWGGAEGLEGFSVSSPLPDDLVVLVK